MKYIHLLIQVSLFLSTKIYAEYKWDGEMLYFSRISQEELLNDSRIRDIAHEKFRSDVPVVFKPGQDQAEIKPELMWVTILDYDSENDIYVGYVINEPFSLSSVNQWDHVLFSFDGLEEYPVALQVGKSYTYNTLEKSKFSQLANQGFKAYKKMANGHEPSYIPKCVNTLKKAIDSAPESIGIKEKNTLRYLRGRCFSEQYSLSESIREYETIVQSDSTNIHAYLSLLSDYSVFYHSVKSGKEDGDERVIKKRMQEISDHLKSFDSEPHFGEKMVEIIYNCEEESDRNNKIPCNSIRYKR